MHRSGAKGRRDEGLLIEGRVAGDTQIKMGDIRMDLMDVEANIIRNNSSIDMAILSSRKTNVNPFLSAFIIFSRDWNTADRLPLLQQLPQSLLLPRYMGPSVFVEMDSDHVFKTRSGKIDRATMQQVPIPESSKDNYSPVPMGNTHGERSRQPKKT